MTKPKSKPGQGQGVQQAGAPQTGAGGALVRTDADMYPSREIFDVIRDMVNTYHAAGLGKGRKPEVMLALALRGRELGIPVGQALEGLYPADDGNVAMVGELMRFMVNRSGIGLIEVPEYEQERVVVRGRRYGRGTRPEVVKEIAWTKKIAEDLKLWGSNRWWIGNPRGQLFARATSEIVRMMFSDVVAGASYVPEELGGPGVAASVGETVPNAPAPPAASAAPAPEPEPPPKKSHHKKPPPAADAGAVTTPQPPAAPTATVGTPAGASPPPEVSAPPDRPAGETTSPAATETAAPAPPSAAVSTPPPSRRRGLLERTTTIRLPDEPGKPPQFRQTAGITWAQVERIQSLATQASGYPQWEANREWFHDFLQETLGLPTGNDLAELTAAEADEAIAYMSTEPHERPGKGNGTTAPGAFTWDMARRQLSEALAQVGLAEHESLAVEVACLVHKKPTLDALSAEELIVFVDEMRRLMEDPPTFLLLLERMKQAAVLGA